MFSHTRDETVPSRCSHIFHIIKYLVSVTRTEAKTNKVSCDVSAEPAETERQPQKKSGGWLHLHPHLHHTPWLVLGLTSDA